MSDLDLIRLRINPLNVPGEYEIIVRPIDTQPNVNSLEEDMFIDGLDLEDEGNYQVAIQTYQQLIEESPESSEAVSALQRILYCWEKIGADYYDLIDYYQVLSETVTTEPGNFHVQRLIGHCYLYLQDYNSSIEQYDTILNNNPTYFDSLCTLYNMEYAELMAALSGPTINSQGNPTNNLQYALIAQFNARKAELFELAANPPTEGGDYNDAVPDNYTLMQNYPNPFNASTRIRFGLPENSDMELTVFNISGQKVGVMSDCILPAGFHDVVWNTDGLLSGVYFVRMTAKSIESNSASTKSIKLLLTK